MTRYRSAWFISLVIALACVPRGVSQTPDEARRIQDWKRAATLFKSYYQDLNSQYSFTGHEDEYLRLWKQWSKDLTALQAELKQRYGESPQAVAAGFEGMSPPEGVANSMRQIADDLLPFDITAKQKEIAGWCVKAGDEAYGKWEAFTDPDTTKLELKADYARRSQAAYERAAEIDASGDYTDVVKKAQDAVAASEKVWKASLKDVAWPGHDADFAGPGDPDTLAREALKFLASVESWSKPEYDDEHIPIAACITAKDWVVNKKTPITKVPTQYSLNVFVAFRGTQDPDIAYAYHMVFYTREEEGVEKAPPFRYVNSRQYSKYKMLMANVPKKARMKLKAAAGKAAASGDHEGEGSPSSGLAGLILRLLLSASLLSAALVSATAAEKVPALTAVRNALVARRPVVGMIALIVGLLCFLRTTLLHFAPHADLLPQLVAVVIGLGLGHTALPAPVVAKVRGLAETLTPHLPLLGIAALALGFLHLFLAGVTLL